MHNSQLYKLYSYIHTRAAHSAYTESQSHANTFVVFVPDVVATWSWSSPFPCPLKCSHCPTLCLDSPWIVVCPRKLRLCDERSHCDVRSVCCWIVWINEFNEDHYKSYLYVYLPYMLVWVSQRSSCVLHIRTLSLPPFHIPSAFPKLGCETLLL